MDSTPSTSKQSFSGLTQQPFSGLTSQEVLTAGVESVSAPSNFRVIGERERQYRNYELRAREVTILVDPPLPDANPNNWLRETFTAIVNHLMTDEVEPHHQVGLVVNSSASQRPVGLSVRRKDQFSIDVLLQLLERCVQSNEQFVISGPLRVVFLHVRTNTGGVTNPRIDYTSDFHTFCKNKRGIISINNEDNLCLARALVVAIAHLKKNESPQDLRYYNYIRNCKTNHGGNLQTTEAQRLCQEAHVDLEANGGGIDELRQFQQHLPDYCITVFTDRRGKETMFEGPIGTPEHPRRHIDLIFGENHFNVIASSKGSFAALSYCRPYKYADSHTMTRQ